jgi:hypothetical protein
VSPGSALREARLLTMRIEHVVVAAHQVMAEWNFRCCRSPQRLRKIFFALVFRSSRFAEFVVSWDCGKKLKRRQ